MYLKRLEIQGFKSFAARTVLDFLPPASGVFSVTAVVGPNGSGKSNITDALRWVMGETSLKNIRGKKSEDVIFSGSAGRGALSAAEVTMTLDNGERALPEFDFPEVVITRRLYRSGESEYLINGQGARLLDIRLLLAQAQCAENSYSIVSQGMIDRLLTVSTAERKDFFDEAAGIKEFQIKRHQAELKLARASENMGQAENLLKEVAPRLKLLTKQVKKLEQRQELQEQLSDTQELYYATLYRQSASEGEQLIGELKLVEAEYREIFQTLTNVQQELSGLARAASREERFGQLQRQHQEAVNIKNDVERRLAIIAGQLHTEYRAAGRQDINWLTDKLAGLKTEIERLQAELGALLPELRRLNGDSAQVRRESELLSAERQAAAAKLAGLQNALLQGESERQLWNLSGLSTVQAILKERQRFGKVYGLLAELGEVDERYRLALEVAAGSHLTSLVVEDETVARQAIEYLRSERLGVATFLPLNKIAARAGIPDRAPSEDGVVGLALQLVRFDQKFAQIFAFIFGSTIVMEDLRAAERLGVGRARMVTVAGDLLEKSGVIKGGFRQRRPLVGFSARLSDSGSAASEALREEAAELERFIKQCDEKIIGLNARLLAAQVAEEKAALKHQLLQDQLTALTVESKGLENEQAQLAMTPEQYGQQLQRATAEQTALRAELAGAEQVVVAQESELQQFNAEEERKKQKVFALQDELQTRQTAVNATLNRRNDFKIALTKVETHREDLVLEIQNELGLSAQSLVERRAAATKPPDTGELQQAIQKLKYQLSLIGGIDEEVATEYSTVKERHDFLVNQLADLTKARADLTVMIEQLDDLMKKKRGVAFKKIRKEFSRYFKILFEGGSADLEEIYGEEPAEEQPPAESALAPDLAEQPAATKGRGEKILTGIDIIANPPGKKIKYLNALSGGERTLTSIALISAILATNPSPFVVLDEVEAALDEANTERFVRIMRELARQSQFIVITHNRVTMHAVDALYGVVMKGDGVSQLLSVKIDAAQTIAESAPVDK